MRLFNLRPSHGVRRKTLTYVTECSIGAFTSFSRHRITNWLIDLCRLSTRTPEQGYVLRWNKLQRTQSRSDILVFATILQSVIGFSAIRNATAARFNNSHVTSKRFHDSMKACCRHISYNALKTLWVAWKLLEVRLCLTNLNRTRTYYPCGDNLLKEPRAWSHQYADIIIVNRVISQKPTFHEVILPFRRMFVDKTAVSHRLTKRPSIEPTPPPITERHRLRARIHSVKQHIISSYPRRRGNPPCAVGRGLNSARRPRRTSARWRWPRPRREPPWEAPRSSLGSPCLRGKGFDM